MFTKKNNLFPILESASYSYFTFLLSLNLACLSFLLIFFLGESLKFSIGKGVFIGALALFLLSFLACFTFFFSSYEKREKKYRNVLSAIRGLVFGGFSFLLSFLYFSFFGNGILPYLFTFKTELIGALVLLLLMGAFFVKVNLKKGSKTPFFAFLLASLLTTILLSFFLLSFYQENPEFSTIFSLIYVELLFLAFIYSLTFALFLYLKRQINERFKGEKTD